MVDVKIALPGFKGEEVDVSATPRELTVLANEVHSHKEAPDGVSLCQCSSRTLFRPTAMPCDIDIAKVAATLDKGTLSIAAPKAARSMVATA